MSQKWKHKINSTSPFMPEWISLFLRQSTSTLELVLAWIRESFPWSRKVLKLQVKSHKVFLYRGNNSITVASLLFSLALVDYTRDWRQISIRIHIVSNVKACTVQCICFQTAGLNKWCLTKLLNEEVAHHFVLYKSNLDGYTLRSTGKYF